MKTIRRRRHENKTDYRKRIGMLKSGKPRLVFRRTNVAIITQYVVSKEAQDSPKFTITSKDLLKYGWPEAFKGSLKSLPASYLTGYLAGKKVLKDKMEQPIVDFGMFRTIHGTKLYAFLKGAIDAGLEISCPEDAFPSEDRITGKHLKEDFSKHFDAIKSKIDKE